MFRKEHLGTSIFAEKVLPRGQPALWPPHLALWTCVPESHLGAQEVRLPWCRVIRHTYTHAHTHTPHTGSSSFVKVYSPSSQGYGFSSSHVWMWGLDYKQSWALKNWCFWTAVLEKTLESPLDCKEIQPVHPKGDPSWVFIGRTDAEAEAPILWPPDGKNWVTGKDPDAGRDWGQKENGTTEEEMAGWHHWHNGHEFEHLWEMVKDEEPGGCCPWGHKVLDGTEWLNNNNKICLVSDSRQRMRGSPFTLSSFFPF